MRKKPKQTREPEKTGESRNEPYTYGPERLCRRHYDACSASGRTDHAAASALMTTRRYECLGRAPTTSCVARSSPLSSCRYQPPRGHSPGCPTVGHGTATAPSRSTPGSVEYWPRPLPQPPPRGDFLSLCNRIILYTCSWLSGPDLQMNTKIFFQVYRKFLLSSYKDSY